MRERLAKLGLDDILEIPSQYPWFQNSELKDVVG